MSNKINNFLQVKYTLIILVGFICLFLIQRFGVLFFGYSHISHPGIDEPVTGVLPCDLLDRNIRAPLYAYQYESRSGDTLIEGFLLAPFFKVFGRSIFSLKMFPLVFSCISLLCWITFLKRYQGLWVVVIFTALFALPPPMFSRLNLIGTLSSHHMINVLIPIQLILLFRIMEGDRHKISFWLCFSLGFCSGLGTYTFYTYIIFNAFCLLFFLMCKPGMITLRRILIFSGGLFIGFSPWIFRSLYSKAGGTYLAFMIQNIRISIRSFIQVFLFNVPHSLGFGYPSREIGFLSILYALVILFFITLLMSTSLKRLSFEDIERDKIPLMQNLFLALFPLFFLICFALSPMHIYPFEYWPYCGLFATFLPADALKYRWFHILFPFYLATVALGVAHLFTVSSHKRTYRFFTVLVLVVLLVCGVVGSLSLYSKEDFGRAFSYKGYNYDQFSARFILGDFSSQDEKTARRITENYPEENRGEAYRCLGTFIGNSLLKDSGKEKKIVDYMEKIPPHHIRDFIYGVVRVAQNVPEEEFRPYTETMVKTYPNLFYENWGFRNLGYKYYSVLINRSVLLQHIPSAERWFFKNYLENFKHDIERDGERIGKVDLLREITLIPEKYQSSTIKGIGMLVGAEMLFDTLCLPDYPLDSRFGEKFSGSLREVFYEGVGSGFAETLCRFWRMLLLPKDITSPAYGKMLDVEWDRCQVLMSRMSPAVYPLIVKGFFGDIRSRHFTSGIQHYLNNKLRQADGPLFQGNISNRNES